MYRQTAMRETTITQNRSFVGESIEDKIERIVNNKEPISDAAPVVFTERKDGVMAEYNIRTDRWELAVEAMDYVSRSKLAKREERLKDKTEEGGKDGGAEPVQATETK